MVIDPQDLIPFLTWLGDSYQSYLITFGVLVLAGLIGGYATTVINHGPAEALKMVSRTIYSALVVDWPRTSLRRILAMAYLVIKESVRRRIVFSVFITSSLLFLIAGWFLAVQTENPAKLYNSFVLSACMLLIVVMSVMMSTFSFHYDIRARTIYTIVTKPVRAHEIFLGKTLGYVSVCTILLAFMWGVSYVFVVRGVDHDHEVDAESITLDEERGVWVGRTTNDSYHRHQIVVPKDTGVGRAEITQGHGHVVKMEGSGPDAKFTIGPPIGHLQARVPVYGDLTFIDRHGNPAREGLNVGKEWTYRSYVEGDTLNTAIWQFPFDEERFDDTLPLEMNIRVFRTNKGDIVSGIRGVLILRNPDPNAEIRQTVPIPFTAVEFSTLRLDLKFSDLEYQTFDGKFKRIENFAEQLTHEGKFQLWLRCAEYGQFFGVAQGDVYLRAKNSSYFWNFTKSFIGLWLIMVTTTSIGLLLSTFLSGPVALLSMVATWILSLFRESIVELITMGPIESSIRIWTQAGHGVDLELGPTPKYIMTQFDMGFLEFVRKLTLSLPNYVGFNTADHVAYGFDISGDLLARHCFMAAATVLAVSMIGYFVLKTRELAA